MIVDRGRAQGAEARKEQLDSFVGREFHPARAQPPSQDFLIPHERSPSQGSVIPHERSECRDLLRVLCDPRVGAARSRSRQALASLAPAG